MNPDYSDLIIFSGNANRALSEEVAAHAGVSLGDAEVFEFSNENIFVKLNQNVRNKDVFIIQPTCHPVNRSIMELLIMIDAAKRASASRITAVLPYYAYGRTDKKDQPRVPITARLIADMITVAGAHRVLTIDLHAGQIQGFFNIPVDELTAVYILAEYVRSLRLPELVVVSADVGNAKRARNFAEMLHVPLAIVEKRRTGNDESPQAVNLIGSVDGRTAVLVDDEVDTASSLVEASKTVLAHGARAVYAAAVHPILSGPAAERLSSSEIREFICTNTVPIPPNKMIDKFTQLSVAPILAEAIQRVHTGRSVGEIYEEYREAGFTR